MFHKVLKISMYAMVYFLLQYHIYEHLQTRTWQKFKFLRQSKTQINIKAIWKDIKKIVDIFKRK